MLKFGQAFQSLRGAGAEPCSLTKQISLENKLPSAKLNKLFLEHKNKSIYKNVSIRTKQQRQQRSELPV